jgi:predicted SAM-dependent methyltransferase
LALGVIEHLTYAQVDYTMDNVHRMLRAGGTFCFDVPDIVQWCKYVVDHFTGQPIPFTIDHVFSTLYGWQRWDGDEHKSGWYMEKLVDVLEKAGFTECQYGVQHMLDKGLDRNRFHRPMDAHIYCVATK